MYAIVRSGGMSDLAGGEIISTGAMGVPVGARMPVGGQTGTGAVPRGSGGGTGGAPTGGNAGGTPARKLCPPKPCPVVDCPPCIEQACTPQPCRDTQASTGQTGTDIASQTNAAMGYGGGMADCGCGGSLMDYMRGEFY